MLSEWFCTFKISFSDTGVPVSSGKSPNGRLNSASFELSTKQQPVLMAFCAAKRPSYWKFLTTIILGYFESVRASIILRASGRLKFGYRIGFITIGAGRVPDSGRRPAMTVKAILDSKGHDVATIEPSADLASAVKLLAARRIGALVVVGADRIAGIISERDIIRALADCGAAALQLPVGQVMTRKVVTCNHAETMSGVMERMTAGKFRHLPVVEKGQLVGIISIGDVVKQRVQEIEFESANLRDYIRTA
jgi:CBS domain-containing protein